MAVNGNRPIAGAALAALDADTARTAEPALDWLLAEDDDLDQLLGLHLLEFLYYQLPMKWLCEPREHHDIAWALADLFLAAGLGRQAEVCRAQATHELIDLWDREPEKARAKMRSLIAASGLDPADNSLVVWGAVHGMNEYAAMMEVSRSLELAVEEGRIIPGSRGWHKKAIELTEQALRHQRGDGSSPLSDVLGERVAGWAQRMTRRGLDLPDDLLAALADPQPRLDEVGESLEPLRWLLEQAAEGMRLTTSGYLPVAVVRAADERFGLRPWPEYRVHSESDLPLLSELRAILEQTRLVTKARGRISLSAKGKKAIHDPDLLARVVFGLVFDETTWEGDGAVFQAYWLLQPTGPGETADVRGKDRDAALHEYLSGRWAVGSRLAPVSISPYQIYSSLWRFQALAGPCGWSDPELTERGRAAAVAGLRVAAQRPRDQPFF